jgi:hypothetical protein
MDHLFVPTTTTTTTTTTHPPTSPCACGLPHAGVAVSYAPGHSLDVSSTDNSTALIAGTHNKCARTKIGASK